MRWLLTIAPLALLMAATLCPAPARAQDAERCGELPQLVAALRDRIAAAAKKDDLAALAKLVDKDDFTYSYGEGEAGNPLGYWKQLKAEGTDVAPIMAALTALDCSVSDSEEGLFYTWPAAADLPYGDLTDAERKTLAGLYGGDLESAYVDGTKDGYYVGWRLVVTEDGHWVAFVAGD